MGLDGRIQYWEEEEKNMLPGATDIDPPRRVKKKELQPAHTHPSDPRRPGQPTYVTTIMSNECVNLSVNQQVNDIP